ncbi:hypothetical protein [Streptomyces uncialis]|uniref:hypothetical protein n=1 Tax=Streptomyces uncialis TaxID=1048205 RepID=UPI000AA43A77|nr:hypothetical protein [Streptomyces uncialis]
MNGGQLAKTGTGALAIGGVALGVEWIVGLSLLIVAAGAFCVRLGFQRRTRRR